MIKKKINLSTTIFFVFLSLSITVSPTVSAIELVISGNGSESESTINTQVSTETTVVQENNATVENDVDINSNTGDNTANDNSGEVAIETGGIESDVTVVNELNASAVETECCSGEQDFSIVDNAALSDNEINVQVSNNTTIFSSQNAEITNNISGSANTGDNTANDNSGNVTIGTGNISVEGAIKNSANISSISTATGFGGNTSVKIAGNLSESQNRISAILVSDTVVVRGDTAVVENNIDWDSNTGGNFANDNLGDVSFLTGDIFFGFSIINGPINIGGVDIDCCAIIDDGDDDGNGGDDGDGKDDDGGGNGDNDGDGNGDDGGGDGDGDGDGDGAGQLLATAASTEILGLSDTSSAEQRSRAFWIGFILVSFGIRLLGDALQRYNKLQLNEAKK